MPSRDNHSISKFKTMLRGGGARPNLFEVVLTDVPNFPSWNKNEFKFMCKAASLPASTIANIDVPFRGRIFKVAGDRTIETWSTTIINDENFQFRNGFEEWMQQISRLENNLGTTNPASYMTNATVIQLGKGVVEGANDPAGTVASGNNNSKYGGDDQTVVELARYQFQDIFPTNISAIDLSYDNGDQIEEFTVEFQVNSYSRLFAGNAERVGA
tara:strand:- start:164 stop:805 length:642 start_codon:yes stop_codon:yes gene_type:complete